MPASLKQEYDRIYVANNKDHILARDIVLSNMPILQQYPDIALLFLIEKIIAGQDIIDEHESIDKVVSKYHLDTLIESDNLLLATMLYER